MHNWKGIKKKKIGKNLRKNNLTITLNVLYAENEKMYLAYVSKHNSNREKKN